MRPEESRRGTRSPVPLQRRTTAAGFRLLGRATGLGFVVYSRLSGREQWRRVRRCPLRARCGSGVRLCCIAAKHPARRMPCVVLSPGALCALSAPLYIFLFGISTLLSHMRAMGVLFNEHEFFIP